MTLSPELLGAVDCHRGAGVTRSEFFERAAWSVIRRKQREERDRRDTEPLNLMADGKLGEPSDVLDYAVPYWQLGDEFTEDDFVLGVGPTELGVRA